MRRLNAASPVALTPLRDALAAPAAPASATTPAAADPAQARDAHRRERDAVLADAKQ